jgi:hypothetical protein
MRLNDYAALHGQFASNDPRMYLSPEVSRSIERPDQNELGLNQSVHHSSVDFEA